MATKVNILIIVALFTVPATFCHATTYYVGPNRSGVSTNQGSPGGLKDTWADMCAGTTVHTGDTIHFANGTYNNTTNDVPVDGLGDFSGDCNITLSGNPGKPSLVFIDFSGNKIGVDGFHITCTGTNTWKFNGLKIYGARSTSNDEGVITFADGQIEINNCVIFSNKILGKNGVNVNNNHKAAKGYFVGCEFYGLANDCVSMKTNNGAGEAGLPADRLLEAHYCYFHDCNWSTAQQGMTMHTDGAEAEGATCKAYFCRFENFNGTNGTAIGHDGGDNQNTYSYNNTVKNCYEGIQATGILEAVNSEIETASRCVINNGTTSTSSVTIDFCILKSTSTTLSPIDAINYGNLTLKKSIIISSQNTGTVYAINGGTTSSDSDDGVVCTIEDNLIYIPATTGTIYVLGTSAETLNFRRNFVWSNGSASFFVLSRAAEHGSTYIDFSDNCMYKTGTGDLFFIANTAATYTGGYNTWTGNAVLNSSGKMGANKSSDNPYGTITMGRFPKELILSPTSSHYRTYGAEMMPGWYRPKDSGNMGTFTRHPIEEVGLAGKLITTTKWTCLTLQYLPTTG